MEQKSTGESRRVWLGYGAEVLTIFLALAVLTGRVYAQSYWNVFGLSAELIDTAFINYAIISPNTALASIFMALGTVSVIVFFNRRLYDLIGVRSPRFISTIGLLFFWVGAVTFGIILQVDSSRWITGTVGLVLGLGYLLTLGGLLTWVSAALKEEKEELSKWEKILFGWVKHVPFILLQIFFVVGFVSVSLWGILDTAQRFGANEAKFMYSTRPMVTLQLDSPIGLEGLASVSTPDGVVLSNVKIITEVSGFLYISRLTQHPPQLHVRAIPVSRIQAIRYEVAATPIGE